DRANAAAGCVWLLAQREQREAVVPEELALAAVARREPDIRYAPRVIGAVVDGGRLVLCRRMGLVALPVLTESGPPEVLAGRISYTARDW
ncbi:hypothetical protein C1Y22_36030, partial [Pseudomonas sp. MPR-R2A5]|uniref:hypothetical protein n=1 Tax=Pseudomonas sp. MPR-R2A5 TaxID=2070622 RepID=UPI000CABE3FC